MLFSSHYRICYKTLYFLYTVGQLTQLEERNAEIESQNSTLVQQNLELQKVEQELRDKLITFVSRDQLEEVEINLRKCEEEKVCKLITESPNLLGLIAMVDKIV